MFCVETNINMVKKVITIVGGRGNMGERFSRWWNDYGYEVRILEWNNWHHAHNLLMTIDAVVVAVPIRATEQVIMQVGKLLQERTVLVDLTSIQSMPLETMMSTHAGPVVSLHPMFGPTIEQPLGHTISVSHGRKSDQYEWLLDSLRDIGFSCRDIDSNVHDRTMDFVQGLEHFITISLGIFLKKHGITIHNLLLLSTPIYRTKLNLLGRVFEQDGKLYQDIIAASGERLETIEQFLCMSQKLLEEMKSDEDSLTEEFKETANWMGDFTKYALVESDKILNMKSDIE